MCQINLLKLRIFCEMGYCSGDSWDVQFRILLIHRIETLVSGNSVLYILFSLIRVPSHTNNDESVMQCLCVSPGCINPLDCTVPVLPYHQLSSVAKICCHAWLPQNVLALIGYACVSSCARRRLISFLCFFPFL